MPPMYTYSKDKMIQILPCSISAILTKVNFRVQMSKQYAQTE